MARKYDRVPELSLKAYTDGDLGARREFEEALYEGFKYFGFIILKDHKVSQATFQTALDQFGIQHLVELSALMSNYAQTAFFLNAFEVTLPEDRTEPVLPI